jgi:quinolinate synthase
MQSASDDSMSNGSVPDMEQWAAEVRRLADRRDAVILAHNYQVPAIQDVADHVGDSLALSRIAASAPQGEIVFCGVHFMAETAKLLSPDKRVLIPDARAGCSLADTIHAEELRAWKQANPGAVVVAYVNTSAAVKAESDICCTSSNAADVVRSIPEDTPILFLPDRHLGRHVQRVTGRTNMEIWRGQCHVHEGITGPALIDKLTADPEADVLVHPECACATPALELVASGAVAPERVRITSTGGMAASAGGRVDAPRVLVATETGILHQLRRMAEAAGSHTRYLPVAETAVCPYMKMITPARLLHCLQTGRDEVTVDGRIAEAARSSVERMIAIGQPSRGGE